VNGETLAPRSVEPRRSRWAPGRAALGMVRHIAGWPVLTLVLLVTLIFSVALGSMLSGRGRDWMSAAVGAGLPWLALLILGLVTAVPYTAVRMQTPGFTSLVPGHRQTLWRVQYGAWICVGALTALWMLIAIAVYDTSPARALAYFLIAYTLLTLAMAGFARPALYFVVTAAMLMPSRWSSAFVATLVATFESVGFLSVVFAIAWVAVLRFALPRLLKQQAARSASEATEATPLWRTSNQNAVYAQIKPRGGRWTAVMNFTAWPGIQQRLALRWPVGWRLALAMGPGFSPTAAVTFVPLAALMAALLYLISFSKDRSLEAGEVMSAFFPIIVIMVVGAGCSFMQGLSLTRTEQSLACLLPGGPTGQQRSRWFARAVIRTAVLNTTLALAIAMLGASLLRVPIAGLLMPTGLIFAGMLSFDLAFAMRAPKRFADSGKSAGFFVPRVIVVLILGMAVMIGRNTLPAIAPWVAVWSVACLSVSAWLFRQRVREVGALPAGNFG
jgi:hypothetical protein